MRVFLIQLYIFHEFQGISGASPSMHRAKSVETTWTGNKPTIEPSQSHSLTLTLMSHFAKWEESKAANGNLWEYGKKTTKKKY